MFPHPLHGRSRIQGDMFMSFSHEDVQRLLQLLDSSHFDELHLEADGIKLSLRRGGAISSPASAVPVVSASAQLITAIPSTPAGAPAAAASQASGDTSLLEVRAPMLGTYYGAPKPGAAPFVTVGDRVSVDTAVGIIEVMKLMNSISAGVDGVVVEVLARDGDLVEFDQVLLRVRPA
jgi:acetyl-CoA carboxylase biotin carboxyl carrier protein